MIEDYYDIITKIENFVDGLMIVDENCIIKYNKQFSKSGFTFDEKSSIGKLPSEVYPNINIENSTCYRAVKYGESTINQLQRLEYYNGEVIVVIDNTFPLLENGKIVGAVSTSKFIDDVFVSNLIDLSNMTTTLTNELFTMKDIIGNSKEIQLLKHKIHMVSRTSSSVLIYGETGTGKELVAQSIHSHSSRSNAPFISQNCAAIPDTLLESIFFGTTKGSYTGAENKAGIFEIANGGTIFLDEINSMALNMQAKLLKAIEEKKITRIGGLETKKIDVRIIAAINESPQDCIKEHRMREDLFYRLSSIQIKVPPLRERKNDLEELCNHFIRYYNKEMKKELKAKIKGISPDVLEVFKNYDWPGNIREFKNVIEGTFNFASSEIIQKEDLPEFLLIKSDKYNPSEFYEGETYLKEALDCFEKKFIVSKAKQVNSNTELANILNISKQTLNYKINKYKLNLR